MYVYCVYRSVLGPPGARGTQTPRTGLLRPAGTGDVSHHGEIFPAAGRVYLIPAHTPHSHACDGRLELYWRHFRAETCHGTPLFSHLTVPYACRPAAGPASRDLRPHGACTGTTRRAVSRRSALLMQVLALFIEQADMAQWRPGTSARNLPARAGGSRRAAEPFPSTSRPAPRTSPLLHEPLKRIFDRPTSISPEARRAGARPAAEHVRHVGHISTDLGFADAFHFSRLFKRMTGRSPQAFRRDHADETNR